MKSPKPKRKVYSKRRTINHYTMAKIKEAWTDACYMGVFNAGATLSWIHLEDELRRIARKRGRK